jgi:hypothetical protein
VYLCELVAGLTSVALTEFVVDAERISSPSIETWLLVFRAAVDFDPDTIWSAPIGHKKIDLFPRVTTQQVRLNILSASGTPLIREFQLFDRAQLPDHLGLDYFQLS